jgi:hypothetical protein
VAERKHRHIVEVGLSLLAHASMPLKFWDEAFLTATYLINLLPSKVINYQTPVERLLHEKPDYKSLRVFGCAVWPNLRPFNTCKLAFRSTKCVFLGYSAMHKGFKYLEPSTGRVYISRDVTFDESVFPFSNLHPNAGALLHKEILLLPSHLCNPGDENCTNLMSTDDGLETDDVQEKSDANWGQNGAFSPSAAAPTTEDPGVRSQGDLLIALGARSSVDLSSASVPVGVSPASTRGGLSPAHSPAPTDSP